LKIYFLQGSAVTDLTEGRQEF